MMALSSKDKVNLVQLAILATLILAIYWTATSVLPGWMSWWLALPAWLIIFITAVSRVKDIDAIGKRWLVRRLGLILVVGASFCMITFPVMGYFTAFPTWRGLLLAWGFALCWLTTPEMPPWWKYISGEWRKRKGQQV